MLGERAYALGIPPGHLQTVQEQVVSMRRARELNPFESATRTGSARLMSVAALNLKDTKDGKDWLNAARAELLQAIQVDYSMADLLIKLVAVDLALDNVSEAQFIFDQFKRVDPISPVVKLVEENNRQKQAAPSPANPDGKSQEQPK